MATTCRWCDARQLRTVADLGTQPLANELLDTRDASLAQPRFQLHAKVCERCLLVQVQSCVTPERLYGEYTYLSSYADSWVAHAEEFADAMTDELRLGPTSLVAEVASNDGYLLARFHDRGIPVVGVEPAENIAEVARTAGIPTVGGFFGRELAARLREEHGAPHLVVANNVWAHVPDLHDFTSGLADLAGDDTLVSIEVPHVLRLLERVAFDTIYHEHHTYFSVRAAMTVLEGSGLRLVDVHELPTHGGSLRLVARRRGAPTEEAAARIDALLAAERAAGLEDPATYDSFAARVATTVAALRSFLDDASAAGHHVAAYGAAAKGTVLLNAVGATDADIACVGDRSPYKVGRFVPGCGIPIVALDALLAQKPRFVLVLPWNLLDEVSTTLADVRSWGGELVTAIPEIEIHP